MVTEEQKIRVAGVGKGWGQEDSCREAEAWKIKGWRPARKQESHSVEKLLNKDLFLLSKSNGEGEECNEEDEILGYKWIYQNHAQNPDL